ncbi:MAG: hypothetical protein FD163_2066 [Hyphomonadaceae bacterium]|nr:MAG: hypothetical protein FD128_384 [Hyphomonadaceae bacterium]KAF0183872.1 MAG: hypothetical protein FD163_2066 [Hyphomonadaceae bacterium]
MTHVILAPPLSSAINIEEARIYLRLGTDEDDGILTMFIKAAIEKVENKYHKALVTRTVREVFTGADIQNAFNLSVKAGPSAFLRPHFTPVSALVAVQILDENGVVRAAPNGLIKLEANKFFIKNWEYSIQIDYQAGFSAAGEIPSEYKQIILEEIATAIAKRDNEPIKNPVGEIDRGVQL